MTGTAAERGPGSGPDRAIGLPGPAIPAWRRTLRYWVSRVAVAVLVRAYLRLSVEGRAELPNGSAVLCFNHLNWSDPFMIAAALPYRPRLYFFGPMEEDMRKGGRNRIMAWTGGAVPYKPGKNDLLGATRHVRAVLASGGVLAIAGEGRIHARESEVLPLNEGAAYFALGSGVPIVPVAINGTSWLRFGGRVRVRIGPPIEVSGRPTREAVRQLTLVTHDALSRLVAGEPERPRPGPFGVWLTELFNDWPEGSRAAAEAAPPTARMGPTERSA